MSSGQENLDARALDVWRRYDVAAPRPLVRLANAGGFSGARFWRGEGSAGKWLLRAWQAGMDADRLCVIHALQRQGRKAGLGFVPEVLCARQGQTFVRMEGRLWQVESWMAGACDAGSSRVERVGAACKALAQLHLTWPAVGAGPCPAVHRRVEVLSEWNGFVGMQPGSFSAQTALPAAVVMAAHETLERALPQLPDLLRPWENKEWELRYCLCDIWRPHVLFVEDRVSGIIDYGSVKVDHVAGDLARLMGSWVGDDRALWDAGMEAYAGIKPLSALERNLAAVLDRSGIILSIANWLLWLWRDQRTFDNVPAAAQRLSWLVERARGQLRTSFEISVG